MTPPKTAAVSNSVKAFVTLHYQFDNLKSGDTYQVCIEYTKSCSPERKIGDPVYVDATVDGVSTTTANIEVTAADQTANTNLIPIKSAPTTTTSEKSCGSEVTGIGWMICPIISALAGLNDVMFSFVESLLIVNPLSQTSGNLSIYNVWVQVRDIANVLFVLVFLIVIASQLSNVGITNYGVKKLLPRLIICAILVNISFIIAQLAVDLSNVLGNGIFNFLKGMIPSNSPPPLWHSFVSAGATTGTAVGVGILATGAAGAFFGGVGAAFLMVLPFIAMALLGFLAAVLTLMFRQAVIPILAILAPIAFVAYMLPNTQKIFDKWKGLFVSMLMVYPLAGLIFGGSQLAAVIIMNSTGGFVGTLIGLVVLSVPLFSLPFLAKQGGPMMGKVAGAMAGLAEKARNPIKDWAKSREDEKRAGYLANTAPEGWRGIPQRRYQKSARRKMTRESNVATDTERFKSTWGQSDGGQAAIDRSGVAKIQTTIDQNRANTRLEREASLLNLRMDAKAAKLDNDAAAALTTQAFTEATAGAAPARVNTATARNIRNTQRELDLSTAANESALRIQKENYQADIVADSLAGGPRYEAIAAAGIDGARGVTRVQATARQAVDKIQSDEIAARTQLIINAPGVNTTNLNANAREELHRAREANDLVGARAAAGILLKNGPGIDMLQEEMMNVDSTDTAHNVATINGIRKEIQNAGVKHRNVVLDSWATDDSNRTISDIQHAQGTLSTLTIEELSSQRNEIIENAVAGSISVERARAVLANPSARKNLTSRTQAVFERIAGTQNPDIDNTGGGGI